MYYREPVLEAIARQALMKIHPSYLNLPPQAVPIETLIENKFGLTIDYKHLTQFGDELGKMVYDDGYVIHYDRDKDDYSLMSVKKGTMLIEASLLEDERQYGRLRFTYAHELAHWIIHKNIFSGTSVAAAMYNNEISEDAIEWQANYLGQAILMPIGQVKRCYYAKRRKYHNDRDLVINIASVFKVSNQAMEIRIKRMGLL